MAAIRKNPTRFAADCESEALTGESSMQREPVLRIVG
jgi:hypothetical protein